MARKPGGASLRGKKDLTIVTADNADHTYFSGNKVIAMLFSMSEDTVMRHKKDLYFGRAIQGTDYSFKDLVNYIKIRRPADTRGENLDKQEKVYKLQKTVAEVHYKLRDLVPVSLASHVCCSNINMFARAIRDAFMADDHLDDTTRQYCLDLLETTSKHYQKQKEQIVREITSRFKEREE